METGAFAPLYLRTSATVAGGLLASTTVAATAASGPSTQFAGTSGPNAFCQIQIANPSGSWAYVNLGVLGSVAAATVAASYPVGPGAVVVVSVDSEVNAATVILASGSGNVVFTRGEGL